MNTIKDPTPRWALLRRYRVQAGGITYLTRFALIQTPWFGVWLHYIHRPDPGGSPHNHPWNFKTLVLHGSYVERYWRYPGATTRRLDSGLRQHPRWSFRQFDAEWAHQIESVEHDTITLVFVGRHLGGWGFFTSFGFREWDVAPTLAASPFAMPGEYTGGGAWLDEIHPWEWWPAQDKLTDVEEAEWWDEQNADEPLPVSLTKYDTETESK